MVYNISLLFSLYLMQGLYLGIMFSFPWLVLGADNKGNLSKQAKLSLAALPYSLKIIWAPLVDALYFTKFGKRKTWLIPSQYLLAISLLVMSVKVDDWLGREEGEKYGFPGSAKPVNIGAIGGIIFVCTFCSATQDIAVDGWGLALLSRKKSGWAQICNTIGQTIGITISLFCGLIISNPVFVNRYFRKTPIKNSAFLSTKEYLIIYSVILLIYNTVVALLVHETDSTFTPYIRKLLRCPWYHWCMKANPDIANNIEISSRSQNGDSTTTAENTINASEPADLRGNGIQFQTYTPDGTLSELEIHEPFNIEGDEVTPAEHGEKKSLSVIETYKALIAILMLKPILLFIAMITIIKIAVAPHASLFSFKMEQRGGNKAILALCGLIPAPISIAVLSVLSKYFARPKPLRVQNWLYIPYLVVLAATIPFVHLMPSFISETKMNERPNGTTIYTYKFPTRFFVLLIFLNILEDLMTKSLLLSQQAFAAKVSDRSISGTYMTFLGSMQNISSHLTKLISKWLAASMTFGNCSKSNIKGCDTVVDGYYLQLGITLTLALILFPLVVLPISKNLDSRPVSDYEYDPNKWIPNWCRNLFAKMRRGRKKAG